MPKPPAVETFADAARTICTVSVISTIRTVPTVGTIPSIAIIVAAIGAPVGPAIYPAGTAIDPGRLPDGRAVRSGKRVCNRDIGRGLDASQERHVIGGLAPRDQSSRSGHAEQSR
jgi:hypothetical protein